MGAYLSQAKTDKESTDEFNDYLVVGASSMQGWRNSQEDAHNSILNYDTKASFFAVYDGHGGAEVSTYCADQFPAFLKTLKSYSEGNYEQALKDAFLGFDKTLLEPDIIETLKVIAAEKNLCQGEDSDAMEDDEDEDLAELHEEGTLPLDEVMEKYKGHPSMPELKKLKENAAPKPQSPYLRGRRAAAIIADAANKAVLDPDCKPEGSSTSKSAAATASGGSSTQAPPFFRSMKNVALATGDNSAEAEAKASSSSSAAAVPMRSANGSVTTTTIKESEQNGSVSSSEAKVQRYETVTKSTDSSMNISHTSTTTTTTTNSNEADCESKQNGNSNSNIHSTKKTSLSQGETNDAAITSTSTTKEVKIKEKAITMDSSSEEDPEFEARQALEYSGDDEDDEFDENDSDGSEDGGYDEDEDSGEEEEDEESILANENFCANMIEEPGKDSGCTAVVALLVGRDLYVANAGDSRCVVCRNGAAVEMSFDHKPEDAEEFERIVKAGGRVTLDGRVNGGLNLSRALGDHGYKMNADLSAEKQMISALPDIKKLIITPDDEFMVLACDGIWNYMSSEEVVDFVRLRLKTEDKKMSEICEELFETCLAPNTMGDGTGCDNMTAVIIRFKPSILELPSKINPTETEDVAQLAANKKKRSTTDDENEAEADQPKAQKRAASPTNREANAEEEKGDKNQAKRIKTDSDMNMKSPFSIVTTTAAANLVASSSSSSTLKAHNDDNKSNKNSNEASAAKVTSM